MSSKAKWVLSILSALVLIAFSLMVWESLDPEKCTPYHLYCCMNMEYEEWLANHWQWPWEQLLFAMVLILFKAWLIFWALVGKKPRKTWVRVFMSILLLLFLAYYAFFSVVVGPAFLQWNLWFALLGLGFIVFFALVCLVQFAKKA